MSLIPIPTDTKSYGQINVCVDDGHCRTKPPCSFSFQDRTGGQMNFVSEGIESQPGDVFQDIFAPDKSGNHRVRCCPSPFTGELVKTVAQIQLICTTGFKGKESVLTRTFNISYEDLLNGTNTVFLNVFPAVPNDDDGENSVYSSVASFRASSKPSSAVPYYMETPPLTRKVMKEEKGV